MQFVSACSQASNCRARFGHWWIYFLRIAWNCTPASASWRKNCPRSTKNAVICKLSISWQASSPRHRGDAGCAMSQEQWPQVFRCCLQGVWPRAGGWGLASSHWAPPCWHTPLPPIVSVTPGPMLRCAFGYIADIASLILPLEEKSVTPL